jgi:general secretion pathway protein G
MQDIIRKYAARLHVDASRRASRRRRGMTLMEVMIVIAIILLLMGALTFGLAGMFQDAQGDTARLIMTKVDQKVKIYKVKKKKLPDSLDELYKNEDKPVDPWGNEFRYTKSGAKGYDIISLGADGKEGGTGADEDIKLSDMSK